MTKQRAIIASASADAADMLFLEATDVPELRGLLALWRGWQQENGLPHRDCFDPTSLPPSLLTWIGLVEIDTHQNPYRPYDVMFRYIGTEMGEFFRIESHTRRHLSDLGPTISGRWFHVYDHLRDMAEPFVIRGVPYLVERDYLQFEIVMLPLRGSPHGGSSANAAPGAVGFGLFAVHIKPNK